MLNFEKLTYSNLIEISQDPFFIKYHSKKIVSALLQVVESQKLELLNLE